MPYNFRKPLLFVSLSLIFFSATVNSATFDLAITRTTEPNGSTSLTLSGVYLGCIIYDESIVVVAAGRISVNTLFHSTPTCLGVPPPGPVNLTVNAGSLAAGHYDVSWTLGDPPSQPVAIAGFDVFNSVPTLGTTGLFFSALLFAAFGIGRVRNYR